MRQERRDVLDFSRQSNAEPQFVIFLGNEIGVQPTDFFENLSPHEGGRLRNTVVAVFDSVRQIPLVQIGESYETALDIDGAAIAVDDVHSWISIEMVHGVSDGIRHFPNIIGIEPSEDFTAAHSETFVDGIGVTVVALEYEFYFISVLLDYLAAAIRGSAVDHDALDGRIVLAHYALDGRREELGAVQAGYYNRD